MTSYSLDTDTITKLLKKHPGNQRVLDRFRREIRRNSLFLMCPRKELEMADSKLKVGEVSAPLRLLSVITELTPFGQSHLKTSPEMQILQAASGDA